jgi:hypothetical protein
MNVMQANDIKVIHLTATPGCAMNIFKQHWGDSAKAFSIPIPDGYVSYQKLMDQMQVRPTFYVQSDPTRSTIKKVDEFWTDVLKSIKQMTRPRYHFVRLPLYRGKDNAAEAEGKDKFTTPKKKGKNSPAKPQSPSDMGYSAKVVSEEIEKMLLQDEELKHLVVEPGAESFRMKYNNVKVYISTDEWERDFINALRTAPENHTFIYVKQTISCAVTLPHEHLGVMIDNYVTVSDHDTVSKWCNRLEFPQALSDTNKAMCEARENTVVQSFLGRMCGYHDNTEAVVYTDVAYVKQHIKHTFDTAGTNSDEEGRMYKDVYFQNRFKNPNNPEMRTYFMHNDVTGDVQSYFSE